MTTHRSRIFLSIGALVLTTAIVSTALYVAGIGTFIETNIAGSQLSCSALSGVPHLLPQPFDPSAGPLAITVDDVAPDARVTADVHDDATTYALVPLEGSGAHRSAIWAGRDLEQQLVRDGRYEVTIRTETASCHQEQTSPILVRRSLVPFVQLRVGETLRLGARPPTDDGDTGIAWTSSDTTVARIDEERAVVGVAPGTTFVSPLAPDGTWQMQPLEVHVTR
jgi:hypothetical protein